MSAFTPEEYALEETREALEAAQRTIERLEAHIEAQHLEFERLNALVNLTAEQAVEYRDKARKYQEWRDRAVAAEETISIIREALGVSS